ncbi:MAG: SdrD B-like domain-containing protein [Caldilineaceae bacterium]
MDDIDLPTGVVQIEGNDPTTVTVPAGGSAGSVDGYEQQGQVAGHIYRDTNGNNTQDVGEPDLPNIQVVITDTFGVTQTVTTDANGNYTATVPIGNTTADVVDSTLPAGSVQTEGTDPTSVTATAGNLVNIGIDGYQPQGLVDGTVYMDVDGNGVFDFFTDTPLRDVTVAITDSNGVTYTVITDGNGYFSQTVPSGDTIVDVDNSDTDLPANVVLTGGSTDPTTITVPGGATATDNTGYVLLASIGDFVWLDLNGDGVQDANEPGLAGVELELSGPGSTQSAITGPNGYYTFDDLVPGTYTISVIVGSLPADVTQTFDPDSTVDHQHTVTIASDGHYEDADFGYQGSASIGDLVWLDSNGDGNHQLLEVGIPGVVITLTLANGWEITTTTAGIGSYDFGGLIAGTYTVTVAANTLPIGAVLTTANQPLTVTLASTQDYNLADFGYQRQAELTGHLFEDTNGNGVQDGGESEPAQCQRDHHRQPWFDPNGDDRQQRQLHGHRAGRQHQRPDRYRNCRC